MKLKLTTTVVATQRAEMLAGGQIRRLLWDTIIGGYGANLTREGASLFFDYRITGKRRRASLGRTPGELSVEAGRKKAATMKEVVRAGRDPMARMP